MFAILACALLPAAGASLQEAVLRVQLLDNGDFRAVRTEATDARAALVPWWNSSGRIELIEEGQLVWLRTPAGARAWQPVAAFDPLTAGTLVRGRVRGDGEVRLVDRSGAGCAGVFSTSDPEGHAFEIALEPQGDGPRAVPRFELSLVASAGRSAEWTDLEVLVPLPAPTAAELRADVIARLDWIVELWNEHGLDREGPRATGFFCHAFDCVTGERLFSAPGGVMPLVVELLFALEQHESELWRTTLERFLEDYLTLGFHPETGLPCKWDPEADRRLDDRWVEVAGDLRFLLDAHERGPQRFRERALQRARRIGETVLARGVLPDGQVAAKYRAHDAAVTLDVASLRRLDVPAQLARLGALLDDERYTDAARNALAELEYTHHWPGTWDAIDPGFDDDFGHYGHRATTMLAAHPDDAAFHNVVESGFRFYAPLWRDALRYGGAIAADQVRSWELLIGYARHEPAALPELRELLPMAVRAHFKGEQYGDGAWGDVTFVRYDPKSNLSVGDLPGTPSNLVWGLALACDESLELERAELRAMFSAVLRSTDAQYRRPYGYLYTQRELEGTNRGGGELRLLAGLVEMLRWL